MRLLNVETFEFLSGLPDQHLVDAEYQLWHPSGNVKPVPEYAILSHRWDTTRPEINYQAFLELPKHLFGDTTPQPGPGAPVSSQSPPQAHGTAPASPPSPASIHKIAGACRQADGRTPEQKRSSIARPHLQYVWIDSICIDKTNASELNTAINSMFQWYQNAAVCYAYLSDVVWRGPDDADSLQQFLKSEWFLRGWTLQELLAPASVEFYDRDWTYIGSKSTLLAAISTASGISPHHLQTAGSFRTASLAQKMSWLAPRETGLLEDRAYCMLGIFGVSLEATYRDGEKEFLRLQQRILECWDKNTPFDDSLLAWTSGLVKTSGLFAPAPSCFREAGHIVFDRRLAQVRMVAIGGGPSSHYPAADMPAHGIRSDPLSTSLVVPWSLPGVPQLLMLFTCGIPYWFTVLPARIHQHSATHRRVRLNCWSEGRGGNALDIELAQGADGTWARVNCARLLPSTSRQLYPSSSGSWISAVQLNVPHRVVFNGRR